jgi:hypothetical protein
MESKGADKIAAYLETRRDMILSLRISMFRKYASRLSVCKLITSLLVDETGCETCMHKNPTVI